MVMFEVHTVVHGTLVNMWHTVWGWLSVVVGVYLKSGCMGSQIQERDTANLKSQPGHPKDQAGSGPRARGQCQQESRPG